MKGKRRIRSRSDLVLDKTNFNDSEVEFPHFKDR